jgi:hypothetical protein
MDYEGRRYTKFNNPTKGWINALLADETSYGQKKQKRINDLAGYTAFRGGKQTKKHVHTPTVIKSTIKTLKNGKTIKNDRYRSVIPKTRHDLIDFYKNTNTTGYTQGQITVKIGEEWRSTKIFNVNDPYMWSSYDGEDLEIQTFIFHYIA